MTKPFKTPTGWRINYRRSRTGEKPFRCQRSFRTKLEAEEFLKALDAKVRHAARVDMRMPDSTTVGQALEEFFEERKETLAASNAKAYANRIKKWQAMHYASIKIGDLTRKHMRAYIKSERARGSSESTIRNSVQIIKSMYDWLEAERDFHVENPASKLKVGSSKERKRRLTQQEHEQIIHSFDSLAAAYQARASERDTLTVALTNNKKFKTLATSNLLYLSAAYQAAIECALRREKLFSLTWRDVDLQRRVITIRDTGALNKETPASIPMSLKLVNVMRELAGNTPRIGAALDEKVFGTLNGERAYRYLKEISKGLGIKDVRWHDLRHEACTRLAELGFSVLQIQRISGHKSLQSLKRYVHISDDVMLKMLDDAHQKLHRTA